MRTQKFNTRKALHRLNKILENYDSEVLSYYDEECYINDILFFLGKSIDDVEYGHDIKAYHTFLTQKIAPMSNEIAKREFTNRLKRGKR
jgi:hypothetical protein